MYVILLVFSFIVVIFGAEFQPYADNSGTVVGISGRNFCVLASDTRLSDQYMIRSRSVHRLHELDSDQNTILLGASGCWADSIGLVKSLRDDITRYKHENRKALSTNGLAHLLSNTLYSRRTFPYYSLCVVAGLDEHSLEGCIYRYDSIGSFERVQATCAGKGEQLIQPMLDEATKMEQSSDLWQLSADGDSFISETNQQFIKNADLTIDQACDIVVSAFRAAAEREITVGDGVEIWILSSESTESGDRKLKSSQSLTRRFAFLPRH